MITFFSERVSMRCQWGKKPKIAHFLGILSPCRRRTEPRPQATCRKMW